MHVNSMDALTQISTWFSAVQHPPKLDQAYLISSCIMLRFQRLLILLETHSCIYRDCLSSRQDPSPVSRCSICWVQPLQLGLWLLSNVSMNRNKYSIAGKNCPTVKIYNVWICSSSENQGNAVSCAPHFEEPVEVGVWPAAFWSPNFLRKAQKTRHKNYQQNTTEQDKYTDNFDLYILVIYR